MSNDPIESYLDELADLLHSSGRIGRRDLAEVEAHLHEATERHEKKGMDRLTAAQTAIGDFGSPAVVAKSFNRRRPAAVIAQLATSAGVLVALGLLVIGASSVVIRVARQLLGVNAVFGLPASAHPSASSCAHWLAVQPTASTCRQAGTLEASDDMTMVLSALGVLGILLAVAMVFVVRAARRRRTPRAISPALAPAIATTAFAAASAGLWQLGINNVALPGAWGAGVWLSQAAVSLLAAVGCGIWFLRAVFTERAVPNPAG
jgi:hypothetical protein